MAGNQHITRHKVITMQYSLQNDQGVSVRKAAGTPVKYLHGAGTLFPKLEQALERHTTGDIVTVRLLPDDAFGKRDVGLLLQVPLSNFPPDENIEVGGNVLGQSEDGEAVDFAVVDIKDGIAYLDGNHPLAGQTLVFEVEVQEIRDASDDEIAEGKVFE
jgi:FKBP-type peptidyl-prolyl cis-trans isomerase SlyD